ncbi:MULTISPECIES: DUF397 domain-containing protein [Streptomyces]|uniref:DUF397 domain-containing protein n=1 Tax=Streptomyces TaxID=1883 RepID=UPI000691C441|nr:MULTISPECIES: DUF397 domain-containing protein [Streptomyces]
MEVALPYHKSSHSGSGGGNCVEVANGPRLVHVRDTKDTSVPGLAVGPGAWAAFVRHTARR